MVSGLNILLAGSLAELSLKLSFDARLLLSQLATAGSAAALRYVLHCTNSRLQSQTRLCCGDVIAWLTCSFRVLSGFLLRLIGYIEPHIHMS